MNIELVFNSAARAGQTPPILPADGRIRVEFPKIGEGKIQLPGQRLGNVILPCQPASTMMRPNRRPSSRRAVSVDLVDRISSEG